MKARAHDSLEVSTFVGVWDICKAIKKYSHHNKIRHIIFYITSALSEHLFMWNSFHEKWIFTGVFGRWFYMISVWCTMYSKKYNTCYVTINLETRIASRCAIPTQNLCFRISQSWALIWVSLSDFFFDIREDEVQEYEYNCRVVYIDSTRLKGKDIILAKEPENLYRPPSKPIVECDWTLEMKIYHSDS